MKKGKKKEKEKVIDSPIIPQLAFPQRMPKSKVDQQFGKFMVHGQEP